MVTFYSENDDMPHHTNINVPRAELTRLYNGGRLLISTRQHGHVLDSTLYIKLIVICDMSFENISFFGFF